MEHDAIPDNDNPELPFVRAVIMWGKGHLYPYVELELRAGLTVKGFVVPTYLEDKLPSIFDGVKMPDNPYFAAETDSTFQQMMASEFSVDENLEKEDKDVEGDKN